MADEFAAYNPLIPQGHELVATVMFEIDDAARRGAVLRSLGGVEDRLFLRIGDDRVGGAPEGDVERTRDDGKISSVHFLGFALTVAQASAFRDPATTVMVGCDHPNYGRLASLGADTRAELARDLA